VLTLALGTGANTAVFSILNGYYRPLPVPDAERIVVLASVLPGDETGLRYKYSYPALQDYRKATSVFSEVFAFSVLIGGLGADGKTTQFVYHGVSGNLFSALGITPAAGRLFVPGEGEQPNAERVVVLGHSYWQRRFGADPAVVGRLVKIDGDPARVVGVAPAGFRGLFEGADMDGYMPMGAVRGHVPSEQFFSDRALMPLTLLARLQPGVSRARAQAAATVVAAALATQYPATEKGRTVRVIPEPLARPVPLPFIERLMPLVRSLLLVLASLVLLIACMNVANLLLVRATVREREMAVRASLGASRGRLITLLLVESLIVAIVAAAAGLALGKWLSVGFVNSIDVSADVPLMLDFHFDWRVFTYALATAIATGLVMGAVPAMRASGAKVTGLLHDGGRGSAGPGRQRLRSLLVVSQVAGSLALLVIAGLFVRTLHRAQQIDLGFDPEHVTTVRLSPHQLGYDEARSNSFYDELDRRIRALPGVETASMSFSVPLGYIFDGFRVVPDNDPAAADEPRASIGGNSVSPTYFDTLRIPILRGRAFNDRDIQGAPRVAIVNETLAERTWPGQDPIGRRITIPPLGESAWQVVGIARNSKYLAIFEDPLPYLYLPMAQNPSSLRAFAIRSTLPPEVLEAQVQREIQALDRDMPVADLRSLTKLLAGNIGFVLFRIGALQATSLGVLGLVLAVVGVYGVVSYRTSQRSREIGIRMALGAVPKDVRRLVLKQGVSLVVAGVVAGLAITVTLTLLITKVMLLVSATDPLTFGIVTVLLSAIALVACYIPALRAMRMQPVAALRHE
jgi:predicted permease